MKKLEAIIKVGREEILRAEGLLDGAYYNGYTIKITKVNDKTKNPSLHFKFPVGQRITLSNFKKKFNNLSSYYFYLNKSKDYSITMRFVNIV